MALVKMKQTAKNRWRIETIFGIIILDGIILGNKAEAEEFIKAYVSTWGWAYEMEEL